MTMVLDGTITFADATLQQSASNTYAVGTGQAWANVTSTRAVTTTYTNTTGKPIAVSISGSSTTNLGFNLTVGGVAQIGSSGWYSLAGGQVVGCVIGIIPAGTTYSVTGWSVAVNPPYGTWMELR